MSLGLTDDQRSLADSVAEWARAHATTDVVRKAEESGPGAFEETWTSLAGLGLVTIAVPEDLGGGGGSVLDLACALEACAACLVPGPLLSTAVAVTAICRLAMAEPAPSSTRKVIVRGATLGVSLEFWYVTLRSSASYSATVAVPAKLSIPVPALHVAVTPLGSTPGLKSSTSCPLA